MPVQLQLRSQHMADPEGDAGAVQLKPAPAKHLCLASAPWTCAIATKLQPFT